MQITILTHLCIMELPTLIGRTSLFPIFEGYWVAFFILFQILIELAVSHQTVKSLFKHRVLWRLIWVCTVCIYIKVTLPYNVILKALDIQCKDKHNGYRRLGCSFDHKLHTALCGISSGFSLPKYRFAGTQNENGLTPVTHSQFRL